jgi:hypothetical protein
MNLLFLIAAFFAEVAGTLAGFGSSTIALPFALFFFDFQTALVLVAFLHIFGNIGRISWFKHGLDRRLILFFGVPSVAASLAGALLISYIPQEILKGLLGVFLLIYAGLSLWKDTLRFPASNVNAGIGGVLSGFLAGLIGTGGALRGAFLTAFNLKKEKYIATAAAIALAVDLTRIPVYLRQGFLPSEQYPTVAILFILALVGSWTGRKIVDKIPQKSFRKIVLVALLLIGAYFTWAWITN